MKKLRHEVLPLSKAMGEGIPHGGPPGQAVIPSLPAGGYGGTPELPREPATLLLGHFQGL